MQQSFRFNNQLAAIHLCFHLFTDPVSFKEIPGISFQQHIFQYVTPNNKNGF